MRFAGVIFDLDGTLLDTLEDIGYSMNCVLLKNGFPAHDMESYKIFVGDGSETLVKRSIPEDRRSMEEVRRYLVEFKKEYDKNWKRTTMPYNGVSEVLAELKSRGIKMSIVSNKPQEFTEISVSHFLEETFFERIVGHSLEMPLKPDPFSALEVAKAMNLSVEKIVFVGDTNVDMRTAVNAGMYGAGVLWGFRTGEELIKSGAKTLISKPDELIKLIL